MSELTGIDRSDTESLMAELGPAVRMIGAGLRNITNPTMLEAGTDYDQKPRVYKINGTGDGSPPNAERAAYKWVFSLPTIGGNWRASVTSAAGRRPWLVPTRPGPPT